MTYVIPSQQTKQVRQLNANDLLGELYVTKNINLDEEGYIKLSPPAVAIMTTDNDADFLAVDAMHENAGNVWIPSQDAFVAFSVGTSPFTNRSSDTNPPASTYEKDSVYFNGTDVVAYDGTGIKYRSASTTWTTVALSLDNSYPVCMAVFDAVAGLMVGNKNIVKLVNTSWATAVTLTLPADYTVTSVYSVGSIGFVATRHNAGGIGKLFVWDGSATSSDEAYGVGGTELYSIKEYGSSIVGINSLGQLLRFNGGGFDELASLPAYHKPEDWGDDQNDHARVSDHGLAVDGELIYIRLDPEMWSNKNNYYNDFVGGTWVYDPKVGLYCKHTPSYTRVVNDTVATSSVNTSTDVITTGASAPITGTPVVYNDNGGAFLTPLKKDKCYYVIKTGANTIKLAASYADAIAGTAINLTGTGNNAQSLHWYPVNDYGWQYAQDRGSVLVLSTQGYKPDYAGRLVFTAQLWAKQNIGTQRSVFNVIQPNLPNRGYFITPKLTSPNIEDVYPMLTLKFNQLGADDKIIVKYRVTEKAGFPINFQTYLTNRGGTWTSTTTFTTLVDLSNVVAGDEIEIIGGVGAGVLAHVSSISEDAGTYTVTLDEEVPFVATNDLMYFVVDNWTKLDTVTSSTITASKQYAEIPLVNDTLTGTFVQFKIELRGIETTVSELQISNKSHKKVV